MAFITRCPHCETSFNITESQLQKAQGIVRCGFCLQTFSALEHQLYLDEEIDLGDIELSQISTDLELEEILQESSERVAYVDEDEDADELELPEDINNSQIPTLEADNEILEDSAVEETEFTESQAGPLETFAEADEFEIDDDDEEFIEQAEEEVEDQNSEDAESAAQDEDDFEHEETDFDHEEDDESLYDMEQAESDSEEEYLLDKRMPEIEPLSGSRAKTGMSARQKPELQILAALYDDSPLERLDDSNLDSLSDEPIAIHQQGEQSRLLKSALIICNILLLLGLGTQYLWQHIDRILLNDRFTPLASLLCQALECPQVTRFDLNQFSTEELIVNAHPQIENALQVDFIFRNNAGYAQVFPRVELNFTDINRRLLANRVFEPQEYLDPELQQFDVLPAGASVQIKLEIADPGPAAINYTLALRTPVLTQPYSPR